jgi:capsular exopolysaccharide synthesis family protein
MADACGSISAVGRGCWRFFLLSAGQPLDIQLKEQEHDMAIRELELNQILIASDPKGDQNGRYKDTAGNAEVERLVAKLESLKNGKSNQVLLITSALLGEGKSTVATRIASSSARNRKSPTLLIDFDIRRPRLHRIFNVARGQGVVDILSRDLPLQSCLKDTAIPNLLILTSGIINGNPLEILTLDKIKRLFVEVRERFENVIVDAPPVIPVSDPILLGRLVDHVVMVVKAGDTSRHVIKRAVNMFSDVKVNISGIILNNMKNVLPFYFDHDYYGYKYFESGDLILD